MIKKKFQRLSNNDKELIKQKTLLGESLNKISKSMQLNKNTVYYNVRKFKPRVNREILIHNLSDTQVGELIGAFAGDGSYYHQNYSPIKKNSTQHRIRYHLSFRDDWNYTRYLFSLLKKINLNPFLIKDEANGRLDISLSSKQFIEFIKCYLIWNDKKTLSICLKKELGDYGENFLRGFARGLMDTDGYVEISNVSCACISEKLINNLTQIFDRLKIKYKLTTKIREGRQKLFLVRVYSESLENYLENIGFSNKYKLESLRKILKKHNRKD